MASWRSVFRSRRMLVVFLLGFSSGVPLMLSGQTLGQWLYDSGLDIKKLAAFASVGLPYFWKFTWAPLVDRYTLPILGRRRGWLLVFQLAVAGTLVAMATLDPASDLGTIAIAATVLATVSASQDIVVDAYNTDVLAPDERTTGSAVYVMGYRTGMLISGALAWVLADHISWHAVYLIMAGAMAIGIAGTVLAVEPPRRAVPPRTIAHAIVVPFYEFATRLGVKRALCVLGFAATYKFSESFKDAISTFFYRDIGFSKTDIGVMSKAMSYPAWALGGAIGVICVGRYGLRRMLVWFGLLQAFTHVCYLLVAVAGADYVVFGSTMFVENVSFAMAGAAFTASQMSFTSPAVSATQLALLTSLSGMGQRWFGPLAGQLQAAVGWKGFFVTTIGLCLPGIAFAWFANAPGLPDAHVDEQEPGVPLATARRGSA